MQDGDGIRKSLGLVSLAVVPFGSLFYVYANRVLSDIGGLPEAAVRQFVLYSSSVEGLVATLETVRLVGGGVTAVGTVLLGVYLLDYLVNTDSYADRHDKKAAAFGSVAGLVWIFLIAWLGYTPAVVEINEYLLIAEQGTGSGADILIQTANGYERNVFKQAISAGGMVLGGIWWVISVTSLIVQPTREKKTTHCSSCGGRMPAGMYDRCPYCQRKL
jgi:hypothetical protein